jgi:hypothetical protein
MEAPIWAIFIISSEEESGLGSWPETNDRQMMAKEVSRLLSLIFK